MKKILILLLLPCFAIAQNKNDNTIIAKGVTFKQVVNTLLDADYRIDKIDSNYYTIKTEYKKLCTECLPEIMFDIRVKDSAATIRGKWRSSGGIIAIGLTREDKFFYFNIMNEKGKVPKICFNEMDR